MPISTNSNTLPRETYRNLIRVHERLTGDFAKLYREHGVSPAQFNVMRVLQDAPPEGAPCQYIGVHLLTKVPDVTRLIDRMVASDLVRRERSEKDRRIVLVNLTGKGREMCERLAEPVAQLQSDQLSNLTDDQVQMLNQTLQKMLIPMPGEDCQGQENSGPQGS